MTIGTNADIERAVGEKSHERAGVARLLRLRGTSRIWLLSTAIAATAVVLYVLVISELPALDLGVDVPWWLFAVAFVATEAYVVHVHFRREAHTFSMTELVLTLGLFMVAPAQLVLAHLIGGAIALFGIRRQRPIKAAFNLSLFTLSTCVAIAVFHMIAANAEASDARLWFAALVAVSVSALLGVGMVSLVIALSEGESDLAEIVRLAAFAVVSALANAALAMIAVELLRDNPSAVILLAVPITAIVVAFRAYARQRARHEHLEFLYESMRATQSARDFDAAVTQVLLAARRMLRAEFAELILLPTWPTDQVIRARMSTEATTAHAETTILDGAERSALARAEAAGGVLVFPRGKPHGSFQETLRERQLDDAMVVPLLGDTRLVGMLIVGARGGDVSTFGPEDGRLLETFAAHASVLLENDRLEESVARLRDLQEELTHQAYHDSLTGLPNRARLTESLAEMLRDTRRTLALLFLDLDDFKTVNDTLGHAVGDELLVQVADRIRSSIRPGDLPTRLGGDEFAVIVRDVDPASAEDVADRLVEAFRLPFAIAGREIFVRGSVGIAFAQPGVRTANELLRRADVAMYNAKESGKGSRSVYSSSMNEQVAQRLELSAALDRALDGSDMSLRYQPIVAFGDRRAVMFEALLRWRHPEHGFVAPESFLPLAQENGVLLAITRWVLGTACAEARLWDDYARRAGTSFVGVSVNLAPSDLHNPGLVDDVAAALEQTGLHPARLTLEITETAAMKDLRRALDTMRGLRSLGVRLALDDFGTGHSSLEKLGQFPIEVLKIAKPFVDRLVEDPGSMMFIDAMLRLTDAMDVTSVAEGVETEAQAELLEKAGCDYGQGFLFARPLAADAVIGYLGGHDTLGRPLPDKIFVAPRMRVVGES